MRKRVRIALAGFLVTGLAGVGWQVLRDRQPVYKGKPVTIWIREGYFSSISGVTRQQANEAVLAVGTNGLPYYVRLLETKADSPLKSKVKRLLEKQPWLKLDFTSSGPGFRRAIGCCGLSILGAGAKPAIPAVAKLLTSGDEDQAGSAAHTLPDIGPEGIQPLTNVLMNPNAKLRYTFALALGYYAKQDYRWSERKPRAPEEVELAAKIIVPILISCLNDADIKVQASSIQSLGWFAKEPEVVIPVIAQRLQNATNDMRLRMSALYALDDYRVKAKTSIPVLLQCLQDKNPIIRSEGAQVLNRIDSEVR